MAEQDVWFKMKMKPGEKAKIERLAERKGTTPKDAVLAAVERAIDDEEPIVAQPGSFLEGAEDLVGSIEGPPDLSTNPKYMEGFGKS